MPQTTVNITGVQKTEVEHYSKSQQTDFIKIIYDLQKKKKQKTIKQLKFIRERYLQKADNQHFLSYINTSHIL